MTFKTGDQVFLPQTEGTIISLFDMPSEIGPVGLGALIRTNEGKKLTINTNSLAHSNYNTLTYFPTENEIKTQYEDIMRQIRTYNKIQQHLRNAIVLLRSFCEHKERRCQVCVVCGHDND